MYYHFNAVKHFIFCLDLLGAIEINLTYLRDSTLLFSSYSCSLIASCTSLLDMLLFCMTFFFFLLTCEKQICDTIKHSTVRQTRTTQLWAWNENHAPLATGNQWARQSWKNIAHVCEYICILQRCKKRCTLHPPPTHLPLAQMVTLGDNDLFYFGGKPGWKHMQEADRQWQVLYTQCLACSCAGLMWTLSIKDRQCFWVQGRIPALAAAAFEHKWSMINLNSHMAVHVTVIATVLVFFKNHFALDGFAGLWPPRHSNIHGKRNNKPREGS